ncbi:hypothetical protein vseg_011413 [Gypsophila vaccaria]
MHLRQRATPTRLPHAPPPPPQHHQPPQPPQQQPYNIIPIHDLLTDHPSTRYPEVRAAASSLRFVEDLRKPPFHTWHDHYDLVDWVGLFFGFQADNVRNTREHLVLHLANSQMKLSPPPANPSVLDFGLVRRFRKRLLSNYFTWCSFLGKKHQVKSSSSYSRRSSSSVDELRRELVYVSLYLLVWGEAANLRFMPECLCYIFYHLCHECNRVLDGVPDKETGQDYIPVTIGENAFLNRVVVPLYDCVKGEVGGSRDGSKPHSAWRNYDDLNEFFWSRRCFKSLKWPLDSSSRYFLTGRKAGWVGKTGFVEQRSFWNVFRSFDRVWVLLVLMLQAMVIVASDGSKYPWNALEKRDVQVKLLTVFISWAGLRLVQSILDAGMQYSLVGRETWLLGVRMVLKSMVAITWIVVFSVFYARIWISKDRYDRGRWLRHANDQIMVFLKAVFVFVIPELLSIVLFIVPWVRNWIEESDFPLIYWVTWWFHTRIFVGRSVRENLFSNVKYSLFWVVVLVSKFAFSYFLQIKPLIQPTRALLKMRNVNYNWHEFFNNTNRIAVVLLWLPVIVIYLVDLQIWYAVFSSIVGAYVGLFSHLGEIRSIWQLRLRFQFFANAMQFNLMPEEQLPTVPVMTLVNKLRDAIQRLRLRYGLGRAYNKIESSQVEATRFALLWNEIMVSMREEDLLSDREVELLELPPNCWDIRVIRWPCILLCNELLLSVSQAEETVSTLDRWIWSKICKSEYRRCAIIEAYDSVKYMLLHHVVKYGTEEHSIVTRMFLEMDHYMSTGGFAAFYKLKSLPQIHRKLVTLIELLLSVNKDTDGVINVLQALYELCVREFPKEKRLMPTLREAGLAPQNPAIDSGLLFENAVEFPSDADVFFYRQLRRLYTILTSRDSMHSVPMNIEARRRIAFFSNSLFMNMPRAPQVEKMMAFTVLTPYYDEDVIYGSSKLQSTNEDGVSILFYLQKIYDDEWKNFMERMRREGLEDERDIWTTKVRDLRLWASYRGQTLSRTVRGMMYYYRALKMLSFLDSASEMDIRAGCQQIASYGSLSRSNNWDSLGPLGSMRFESSRNLTRAVSGVSLLYKGPEFGNAMMKFTYVIACQVYGLHKIAGDSRAEEILYLMKNNEALRVAYVDEVHRDRDVVEYYSVLVKYDQQLQREVEIYRVQLPGPIKLGEGKPENQNHAIIFTRGDALQTIDMNQDNYFEEALKVRNLLDEFNKYYGIRKPTILGVRENIFTGSVSSLAWFMSAQETSFVTLGQRVLANPLKVRMHYGHPDIFDRFWFLTRGGVSKASKLINLSEDIFAGFNCTLRGGNVTHHEYIQVGKGRDVGLNQIAMFEAKVASGNGEQLLSRDVYRLGHRLDFFRMLSVFYTTVGFYFNTMMVVLSVYTFLWGRLYLALSGVEKAAMKNSSNNAALGAIVNQQFIIQIGMFTALPMIVENSLEHGFLPAVWDFLKMQLQLASLFFTFSMGTRCHYFGRTILHGGAKYRATGRGFVVEHKKFAENYRLYSRSHFVKAIELGVILIVYASHSPLAKGTFVYIAMSISSWFLVVSWIMAPFVFNPSGFDWLKAVYDFEDFITWIWYGSGVSTKADRSWETWWYEEQEHLKTTGLWGKLLEIILDLRFFFFQYGIVYHLKIAAGKKSIGVYLLSWVSYFVLVGIYIIIAYARDKFGAAKHIYYRIIQFSVIFVTVLVTIILLKFTDLVVLDLLTSLLAFIPTGWGIILIAQVLRPFLQTTLLWETVVSLARLYDLLFGIIVMAPVAFLSWMPGFQSMQTRILFNDAFSRGLEISQLLSAK